MDCDLSHPPEALPRMLGASADADLVLGSRYVEGGAVAGWPLSRRVISRGGCLYACTILGVRSTTSRAGSSASGAGCWNRSTSPMSTPGYAFQIELTYRTLRLGGRVVEVPITFTDRTAGSRR